MKRRVAGMVGVCVVLVVGTVMADTDLGSVSGVGYANSDTGGEACCRQLSTLHGKPGSRADMDEICRGRGGDVVKDIHSDPNGYCSTYPTPEGSPYKYECRGPMVGRCYQY